MGENTSKFILNALRKKFGFPGVPLRLVMRYKNKADSRPAKKGPSGGRTVPQGTKERPMRVYVQKSFGRRGPGKYERGGRQPG